MTKELAKGISSFADIAFQLALMLAIALGFWWLVYLFASGVWNVAWDAVSSGRIGPESVALIATGALIVAGYVIGLLLYQLRHQVRQLEARVDWLNERVTELEGSLRLLPDKLGDC